MHDDIYYVQAFAAISNEVGKAYRRFRNETSVGITSCLDLMRALRTLRDLSDECRKWTSRTYHKAEIELMDPLFWLAGEDIARLILKIDAYNNAYSNDNTRINVHVSLETQLEKVKEKLKDVLSKLKKDMPQEAFLQLPEAYQMRGVEEDK